MARASVQGNKRIASETILSHIEYSPGQDYGPVELDGALKTLFDTGLFSDVTIRLDGNTLAIRVTENPYISQVAFEGNQKIRTEQLRSVVASKANTPMSKARVRTDTTRITDLYARSGRYGIQVEPKVVARPNHQVVLVFEINEGPKASVKRISFIGNSRYSDRRLRRVISTTESNLLSWFKSSDVYDPDRVNVDRDLLRRFYLNEGFADFRVVSTTTDFDRENNAFYIAFAVDEGVRYRFGKLPIVSNVPDVNVRRLRPVLAARTGSTYSLRDIERTLERLTKRLAESGYAFARVEPTATRRPKDRAIDITFYIEQGPKTYIERINIVGNTRTRDHVIRREFDIAEGDPYTKILIDRAIRRLYALRYFKTVNVRRTRGSGPDQLILTVTVEEDRTLNLRYVGRYKTKDGVSVSIDINETNLFGTGLKGGTKVSRSKSAVSLSGFFTIPHLLGTRSALRIGASYTDADKTTGKVGSYTSYESKTLGGDLQLSFPITDDLTGFITPSIAHTTVEVPDALTDRNDSNSETSNAIYDARGKTLKTALTYGLIYNSLNDFMFPTDGIYARIDNQIALPPGDSRYFRMTGALTGYLEVAEDITLKGKVQAGKIVGLGSDAGPAILDTFFKGGAFVRGFRPFGLGPRDIAKTRRESLGGTAYYGGSVELIFPVFGLSKDYGMRLAAFADVGALINPTERTKIPGVTIWEYNHPRASIGASIIWQSPIGPLRFDFSKVLSKGEHDETQVFQFSAATAF